MKLKYQCVIKEMDSKAIAVPVDTQPDGFNGMIKLNDTGRFIFAALEEDISMEELCQKVTDHYDITVEQAAIEVEKFLCTLEKGGILQR